MTDADNTLWDTDEIYARAQLRLLEAIEERTGERLQQAARLDTVREIDQKLAMRHPLHLKYPPRLLAAALVQVLGKGASADGAVGRVLEQPRFRTPGIDLEVHERHFRNALRTLPSLRPGVRAGLRSLDLERVVAVIATESSEARCRRVLDFHQLSDCFRRVFAGTKSVAFYKAIVLDVGAQKRQRVMVGDQLDRDVEMARAAGYVTIHFPGGFNPSWVGRVEAKPDHRIDTFAKVPDILSATCPKR